jgi:MFS family permease
MNHPRPAAPDAMPSASLLGVTRPRTIPAVIKRNTLLLATAQAFVGVGNQMVPTLGAIMVIQLLGSPALAGLATSILGGCRFLVAYPAGHVADTYGRRAGLLAGLLLSLVGAIAVGLALMQHAFLVFLGGLVLFGLGVGAGQQLRLAAADLYPPSRRAEGLGYVLMGSLIGALGGPLLISAAQTTAPALGLEPLALAWLLIPLIVLPSLGLVWLIHPDPKEIAANLSAYYPGQAVAPRAGLDEGTPLSMGRLLGNYPVRVALSTSFALQGTMAMVMAMTSLALAHHGYALPAVSLAVAIHVVGMYGLSLPLGHLTDRRGRRAVMLGGVVIAGAGSGLVSLSSAYGVITAGTFLVGLGWSCMNVAVVALLADTTRPHERGRAIGINDTVSGVAAIILPLVAGPLVALCGLASLAAVSVCLLIMPFVFLLRLHETSPGCYMVQRN